MSSSIAALPPPAQPVPHKLEYEDGTDAPSYSFSELWQNKKEGLTFGDVLDIINPLQHIPIVSSIYRMATGDEIGVGSRILGGALFGGPLGLLVSGLTAIAEDVSGGSVEQHVASLWNSFTDEGPATSQIAAVAREKIPDPQTPPAIEAAVAAPADVLSRTAGPMTVAAPVQTAAATQIFPPPPAHTRPSPQPLPRPPVSVSPMMAVHRIHSPQPQPPSADRTAESRRIALAVEQAQRAQAGLLLANLGVDNPDPPRGGGDQANVAQFQPFKAHPYMLPHGAPPQLISQAMERALAKYQAALQQRAGTVPVAAPQPLPAPVR